MKYRFLFITTGGILLFGGAMLSVAYGTIPLSDLFIEKLQPAVPPGPQSIGATSTPPGVLEALRHAPPQAQIPSELPIKPNYGPLVHTYTDTKRGFTVKYPDGLSLSNTEGATFIRDQNDKGFRVAMQICDTETPCKSNLDISSQSLSDIKKGFSTTYSYQEAVPTYGSNLSYNVIPIENTIVTLMSGKELLKQVYRITILNVNGNDVTEQVCDECAGLRTQYIALIRPHTFLLVTTSRFNKDPDLEARIIQSISYK